MLQFIVNFLIIVFGALIQITNVAFISTLKPNIVLACLVAISVFQKDWIGRSILILMAEIILTFQPTFGWMDLVLISTFALTMALVDFLPWKKIINIILAVIFGTTILNITLHFSFMLFLKEAIMNTILAILVFWLIELIYAKTSTQKENRFRRGSLR
jgi:hypothetical protein